jgi:hypothetical protein
MASVFVVRGGGTPKVKIQGTRGCNVCARWVAVAAADEWASGGYDG